MKTVTCFACGKEVQKCTSEFNRSTQRERNFFCSKKCTKLRYRRSLADIVPALLKELHPVKNGKLDVNAFISGNESLWWICTKGHEWETTPTRRACQGSGCLYCAGKLVSPEKTLAVTHPELAKQWHADNKLTPYDISAGSGRSVLWKCPIASDHVWKAPINRRAKTSGCSCCSGYTIVESNCLNTTHPDIAIQWHPTKNGHLTPRDVGAGSNRKFWWGCGKGHEWQARCTKRAYDGRGCPICCESHGEKKIAAFLQSRGHGFERQHTFETCRDKQKLRFDFFVENPMRFCIEYQGKQHYKPHSFGGHRDYFQETRRHDKMKASWCKENNTPLLRIPYWKYDRIEAIIANFISRIS